MKHVLNIALMAVVVLGTAMLEATNWGYAVLAIPAVIWAKPVLNLLHKLPVLAAAFGFWLLFSRGKRHLLVSCSMAYLRPLKRQQTPMAKKPKSQSDGHLQLRL